MEPLDKQLWPLRRTRRAAPDLLLLALREPDGCRCRGATGRARGGEAVLFPSERRDDGARPLAASPRRHDRARGGVLLRHRRHLPGPRQSRGTRLRRSSTEPVLRRTVCSSSGSGSQIQSLSQRCRSRPPRRIRRRSSSTPRSPLPFIAAARLWRRPHAASALKRHPGWSMTTHSSARSSAAISTTCARFGRKPEVAAPDPRNGSCCAD